MGLIVALALVWSAWSVFRQSYDQLMDRELADEDRATDQSHRACAIPTCAACTICARARRASRLHPAPHRARSAINLTRAHEVSDAVEAEFGKAFPNAEVIIHQDPEGVEMPHGFKPK